MKVKLLLLTISLLFLLIFLPEAHEQENHLFYQDFDGTRLQKFWSSKLALEINWDDENKGNILRQSYKPSATGTPYVGTRFKLAKSVSEATLLFNVKFDKNFEFVRGGKMHGLAGGSATTGCREIDPKGWSVRLMWRSKGQPVLYLYDQNRQHRCGDDVESSSNFTFKTDVWYQIGLYVKLNSAVGSKDGIAALYIDGKKLIERSDLNLAGTSDSQIDYFLYNSFYGGSDSSWSPSRMTYAYYDNFEVIEGKINDN